MLLSVITFLPVFFALVVCFWPHERTLKLLGLGLSTIHFALSLTLLKSFDPTTPALQMAEQYAWIPNFGVSYFLAVDGISLWLVLLTTFLTPLVILSGWASIETKFRGFLVSIFILQTAMLGTFLAIDAIFFYVFWELSLIPMYFMIGIWGGSRRIFATVKFFIFTMAGSVLMLLGMIYLMFLNLETTGQFSASLLDFYNLKIPFVEDQFFSPQTLLFVVFGLAFAIKVPVFLVHSWLPDAHVEAPTPGSVILAGVMLKMGTYGFLRWVLPLFPEATAYYGWVFLALGAAGIILGACLALIQTDIKKLVAYSSVSHMGYVMVGLFSLNLYGVTGSLYQMLNHGISTSALFILVGMIYERVHSREISQYGGLAKYMPHFAICFFIVTASSIAVPLTNGFIGEFLILLGAFNAAPVWGYLGIIGVILGAAYMLWMVKRVFFGEEGHLTREIRDHKIPDMNVREWAVCGILIFFVFWMGIFPRHFLSFSEVSLSYLVDTFQSYSLEVKGSL
jgi:NADH-quinone oxidoreductase subunit M